MFDDNDHDDHHHYNALGLSDISKCVSLNVITSS